MEVLFLDDVRVPGDVTWVHLPQGNYTIVRNYSQFVKELSYKNFDHYCFDYDLWFDPGYEGHDGLSCLKHLVNKKGTCNLPVTFHTQNEWGREKMEKFLLTYPENLV